jgi:hypothetical protein
MDEDTKACLIHFAKALDKIEARLELFGHFFMKEMYPNDKEESKDKKED